MLFVNFLNGPFPASFSLFSSFQHIFKIQLIVNKICQILDLNPGFLVSDAAALPTEPQPLPKAGQVQYAKIDYQLVAQ